MEEPIEIVIRKTQETSTQTESPKQVKSSDTSTTQKAVNTALVNAGKQLATYGFSQYGNLTGNTIAQRQMNNVSTLASYAMQIAVGGWVGAIAVGVQVGMGAISNFTETSKANQQSELLYQRSGNITIDGGRGTND